MKGQPCMKGGWRVSCYEGVPGRGVMMMLVFFGQFLGVNAKEIVDTGVIPDQSQK